MSSYLALSKPRIMLLLDLAAATSVILAAGSLPIWPLVLILIAGSLASAGSSAINSYLDRDIDSVMRRTMARPIPSGQVSPRAAVAFGVLTILSGVAVATITLNPLTGFFVALGATFYIGVYTVWLKRRSVWNIVLGGSAGSCAALAGWSAFSGSLSLTAWLVAILIFLWTPGHFWSLSMRAKSDYQKVGLPMLPVLKSKREAILTIVVSNVILVPFTFLLYVLANLGLVFLIISTVVGTIMVGQNMILLASQSDAQAWRTFKVSSPYLAFVFFGAIADTFIRL